jgi:hypothetical protein
MNTQPSPFVDDVDDLPTPFDYDDVTGLTDEEVAGLTEDELVVRLRENFDFEAAIEKQAKQLIWRGQQRGAADADGELHFPGHAPWPYEPHRLVSDGAGHIIEQDNARTSYRTAEAQRVHGDAQRARARGDSPAVCRHMAAWADQLAVEAEAHAAWVAEHAGDADLTFGRFVRSTGIWKPGGTEGDTTPPAA